MENDIIYFSDFPNLQEILNMAMEKQIELLNQKVAALTRENKELKRKNEKLQKALRKQDLNFIKNL